MGGMTNQTHLPVEKDYPQRLVLPDAQTIWEVSHPAYFHAPVYARDGNLFDLLDEAGVEVKNEAELKVLGSLPTSIATELYGESIAKIRNPLGRTGINGTGIFYHAGEAAASDMAIVREHPTRGLEVLLAYSRRWGLPGGFQEESDKGNGRTTAVREAAEETGIDLVELGLADTVETVVARTVKPNSRRATDYGFITTQVEAVLLPDSELGNAARASDDATSVMWAAQSNLDHLKKHDSISDDHYTYASTALTHFAPTA